MTSRGALCLVALLVLSACGPGLGGSDHPARARRATRALSVPAAVRRCRPQLDRQWLAHSPGRTPADVKKLSFLVRGSRERAVGDIVSVDVFPTHNENYPANVHGEDYLCRVPAAGHERDPVPPGVFVPSLAEPTDSKNRALCTFGTRELWTGADSGWDLRKAAVRGVSRLGHRLLLDLDLRGRHFGCLLTRRGNRPSLGEVGRLTPNLRPGIMDFRSTDRSTMLLFGAGMVPSRGAVRGYITTADRRRHPFSVRPDGTYSFAFRSPRLPTVYLPLDFFNAHGRKVYRTAGLTEPFSADGVRNYGWQPWDYRLRVKPHSASPVPASPAGLSPATVLRRCRPQLRRQTPNPWVQGFLFDTVLRANPGPGPHHAGDLYSFHLDPPGAVASRSLLCLIPTAGHAHDAVPSSAYRLARGTRAKIKELCNESFNSYEASRRGRRDLRTWRVAARAQMGSRIEVLLRHGRRAARCLLQRDRSAWSPWRPWGWELDEHVSAELIGPTRWLGVDMGDLRSTAGDNFKTMPDVQRLAGVGVTTVRGAVGGYFIAPVGRRHYFRVHPDRSYGFVIEIPRTRAEWLEYRLFNARGRVLAEGSAVIVDDSR